MRSRQQEREISTCQAQLPMLLGGGGRERERLREEKCNLFPLIPWELGRGLRVIRKGTCLGRPFSFPPATLNPGKKATQPPDAFAFPKVGKLLVGEMGVGPEAHWGVVSSATFPAPRSVEVVYSYSVVGGKGLSAHAKRSSLWDYWCTSTIQAALTVGNCATGRNSLGVANLPPPQAKSEESDTRERREATASTSRDSLPSKKMPWLKMRQVGVQRKGIF